VVPEAVRTEAAEPGLTLTPVGALVSLVSQIAAGGDKSRQNRHWREPEGG